MRAIVIDRFGGPEELVVRDLPAPRAGAGEVVIRVAAVAVNPADVQTRAGAYAAFQAEIRFPMILGWDVAGVVDAVGPGVGGVAVGDRVVAMSAHLFTGRGVYAEWVALPAALCASAPGAAHDLHRAAALPLAAVTAIQALRTLGLVAGQRLLVTGATGAVGGFALQLAAHAGLHALALVPARDADLARELGAVQVLSREEGPVTPERCGGPVDGVFDTAGATASIAGLADGGRYVSTVAGVLPDPEHGITPETYNVKEDGADLAEASRLAGEGVLTLRVARELPFEGAREAHERVATGGLRGKILLRP
jgi:NADPH2:quinone reductase